MLPRVGSIPGLTGRLRDNLPASPLRTALERLQHPIDAEAARLLAGRELLEGGKELSDVLLRRHEQEGALYAPTLVIHALVVGGLEGVRAQVEELREAQRHERVLPDVEAVRRGQMFVAVAEVILPELAGLVTPRLLQLGDRYVARLEAFLRTRQPTLSSPVRKPT